jgi:hypothetical protein
MRKRLLITRSVSGVIDANGEHLANWLGDGASTISAGQALARSRRHEPSALAGITIRQVVVADLVELAEGQSAETLV